MAKDEEKKEVKKEKKAVSTAKIAKETKVDKKAKTSTEKKSTVTVKKAKKEDKVLEKKEVKEKKTSKVVKDTKPSKSPTKKSTIAKKVEKKEIKEEKTAPKKDKKTAKTAKSTTVKKTAVKKASPKKETKAKKASSKTSTKKTPVSKKESPKKAIKAIRAKNINVLEYYDLPYRYNDTTVKLLAQTPKVLFVYWDISDTDRENYINQFGADFFNNTKPVLIVHNETLNYSFELDIDDFANCWYIHVEDSSSKYKIELGRRSKVQDYYIPDNYIYVTSSNEIESPNDHILFEDNSVAYFRNVKTGEVTSKNIATLSFMRNMGKVYNIYDMYKQMYKDEIDNPSSKPSSGALLF